MLMGRVSESAKISQIWILSRRKSEMKQNIWIGKPNRGTPTRVLCLLKIWYSSVLHFLVTRVFFAPIIWTGKCVEYLRSRGVPERISGREFNEGRGSVERVGWFIMGLVKPRQWRPTISAPDTYTARLCRPTTLVAHVVRPILDENVRWNTFWHLCNIQTDVRNIGLTCVTSSMLPIWLLVWY